MIIIDKVSEIKQLIIEKKSQNLIIGFVPTMGALHQGHISLIERAKKECDVVVSSIFVNPTQFNDSKDFEKYPRTLDIDSKMLEKAGCHILFAPNVKEIYDNEELKTTPIDLGFLDQTLEGEKRPGHYSGVVTIVEKLFKITLPDKVYMGLKDFQQVLVVKKLIEIKHLNIEIIGCETLRDPDGLAMSSRNTRLSIEERTTALQLSKCLYYIKSQKLLENPVKIIEKAKKLYLTHPNLNLEYLELRNSKDLTKIDLNNWETNIEYVVLIAAFIGDVRLIDNLII